MLSYLERFFDRHEVNSLLGHILTDEESKALAEFG